MNPSQRPTVVALHSSAASGRQWQPYRAASAERLDWITPTLMGYGADETWNGSRNLSLDDEVDQLAPALLAQAESFHLVGHSYGGAVALQFAVRHPRRVRSLTLYEPVRFAVLREAGLQAEWNQIRGVAAAVQRRTEAGDLAGAAAGFLQYWSGAATTEALCPRTVAAVSARMPKVCADFDALFADPVPLRLLRVLKLPVTLLLGQNSPAAARGVAEVLATALPQARLRRLAGFDHLAPLSRVHELQALFTHAALAESRPELAPVLVC